MSRVAAAGWAAMAVMLAACSSPDNGGNEIAAPNEADRAAVAHNETVAQTPTPSAAAATIAVAGVPTLCRPGEIVLFSCGSGARTMSVCGAADPAQGAQYRASRGTTRELAYPADGTPGSGTMRSATAPYSGGGEAQIQFDNGGFTYVAYSRMVRTRFDGKGNDPAFSAGVAVIKGDKTIAERICTAPTDADLNVEASTPYMPVGEFIYIPEKDGK
ncbi:hypothetical protein FSZ31_05210 [Sphingorhabdus soli]|uniref:Lipoprotein n=1 Tax=Flavisphingopyxis soli TaxID=2601267 RepID=A0A5C6UTR7_9SPHN|nr:hypothetical protein [Sphingorhabdus soli]TXC74115.1 hypothetical protein FSZ31_05210 [Sphingorhabdus soli]